MPTELKFKIDFAIHHIKKIEARLRIAVEDNDTVTIIKRGIELNVYIQRLNELTGIKQL